MTRTSHVPISVTALVIVFAAMAVGPLAARAHAQSTAIPLASASNAVIPFASVGAAIRGTNSAYDSVNNVRLVVASNGPTVGVFVNADGAAIAAPFLIDNSGYGQFPAVTFSPDLTNGAGGTGAFLVTWSGLVGTLNNTYARVVSYTANGYVVGSTFMVSDGEPVYWEVGNAPLTAYSSSSRAFSGRMVNVRQLRRQGARRRARRLRRAKSRRDEHDFHGQRAVSERRV